MKCLWSISTTRCLTAAVVGYKAALSVSVFHTIGSICCMEDTMGLGKFFTSAVTAWEEKRGHRFQWKQKTSELLCDLLLSHLEDFHLKTTVRWRSVRHLQSLHKCFCELLHHGEDQCFGCTLKIKRFYNFRKHPFHKISKSFLRKFETVIYLEQDQLNIFFSKDSK